MPKQNQIRHTNERFAKQSHCVRNVERLRRLVLHAPTKTPPAVTMTARGANAKPKKSKRHEMDGGKKRKRPGSNELTGARA
jgi:hypothetical protein